jgi:hypothetical protein
MCQSLRRLKRNIPNKNDISDEIGNRINIENVGLCYQKNENILSFLVISKDLKEKHISLYYFILA